MQTVDRVDTSVDRKIETLFPALELDGFASEKKLFNPLKRIGTFESGLLNRDFWMDQSHHETGLFTFRLILCGVQSNPEKLVEENYRYS